MVKPLNYKPNILQRLKKRPAVRFPNTTTVRAETTLLKDKGRYLGACNRRDCLKPGANWYNHSTEKYYCEECAHWLNEDDFNQREAMKLYGHDLCTEGEYVPPPCTY